MSELEHISTIMRRVFNDLAERASVDVVSVPVVLRQTEKEKKHMEEKTIFESLAAAQAEFPSIPKNRTAKVGTYSYKYADLSDIVAAIRPTLAKHGLAFTQFVLNGDMVTRLLHRSGLWIEGGVPLVVPADGKPQTLGSALTYSRRYSLGTVLGIVTDEDDDAQTAQHAPTEKLRLPQKEKPTNHGDYPRANAGWEKEPATDAMRKKLFAMSKQAGWEEDHVKDAIFRSFGKESTKDLTKAEMQKLFAELEKSAPPDHGARPGVGR